MSKVLDHDTVWFQELAPRDYYNENDLERTVKLYLETIFPDYKVKININDCFGSHSSILGNTGSGKSCTISSMIQTLFKKENYKKIEYIF